MALEDVQPAVTIERGLDLERTPRERTLLRIRDPREEKRDEYGAADATSVPLWWS